MTQTRTSRFPRLAWIGLLAVIGIAVAAWFLTRGGERNAAPSTVQVERGDIEITVSALGKIAPKTYVDVGAQVSGQLDTVHVEVGDRVEQGQLLAEIDPRIFESRVEADRARVESLQAQRSEREATLALAKTTHERNVSVAARGLIAKDLVDQSAAQLRQAEAQLAAVRASLKEAQSTLDGDVANLGYARIYAPISGTVVSQTVLEGQTVNSSMQAPTLMRIADLETMTVTAQVAEADIVRIEPGMKAYFSTLGQPDRRWTGSVRQVLPTPDIVNEVVLYKVLIDVGNEDGALLPDMTAQVFFEIESARDALLVPAAAVQGGREARVMVAGPDGKPQPREVKLGLRSRDKVQVLAGLEEGERVLLPEAGAGARGGNPQQRPPGMGMFGGPRR